MLDVRTNIQDEIIQTYLKGNKRSTVIAGTGAGKSRIAIEILKELDPQRVLLLTNSELLRDNNWKVEFDKFGFDWSKVQSETYQKMYKESGEWDMIIMDEVDFALSPQYSKVFTLKSKYLLCMTGFITEEKEQMINEYAPIIYRVSTQELQEKGALNKSQIIVIQFPLSKENNISIKKKVGGTFNTSENALYKYYDKEYQKAMIVKTGYDKKVRLGITVDERKHKAADFMFLTMAAKRKSILNKSDSSVRVVKQLVENIHKKQNNKVIIFSALTEQSDKFGYPTFHGKPTSTEKDLSRINSGEIKTLAVCKAISRGVNMTGINYLIRESFDSSETEFNQSHGRGMRLSIDDMFTYIVLIPYYEDLCKMPDGVFRKQLLPTQALKWATKMMESFSQDQTRTIRLGSDLVLPSGIEL